jgi:hypothetical protein
MGGFDRLQLLVPLLATYSATLGIGKDCAGRWKRYQWGDGKTGCPEPIKWPHRTAWRKLEEE